MRVPFGRQSTYREIAEQLGQPGAVRAVGRANATNPIPIVIPCHRILGADGKLHGYSAPGGLETKAWLLRHEGSWLL
jgi:methylated-DNA-[protein]-cysteine S-methyltransferase